MKETRFSILAIGGLFALLVLLAWLQYAWLGQIGDATRERLKARLQTDTRRFADDFNKEIRNAYFFFQIDPGDWLKNDWTAFNGRYKLWQTQTAYPQLVRDFYFVRRGEAFPIRYDSAARDFKSAEWTDELRAVEAKIKAAGETGQHNFEAAVINQYTLLLPNYAAGRRERTAEELNGAPNIKPELSGFLVIKLDETVINQILADLNRRYFPLDNRRRTDEAAGRYYVSILNKADSQIVYPKEQSAAATALLPLTPETSDESIPLFDVTTNNFMMIVNSRVLSQDKTPRDRILMRNNSPPGERFPPPPPQMTKDDSVKVQMTDDRQIGKPSAEIERKGLWILNVRHADGSLENFIANTRRKNLAISFGILLLLAASVAFVFLTARRAQILAQRQLDFVSAVSHEFRTPLAVIYSAGENLSDGVVDSAGQVARYGNLIKREGKKLSAMVEQILEFAGARSGRKKYDLRETEVARVIENALEECQSLIAEKGFTVEKEIAADLPKISADSNALSHAVQNLITNAVKYAGAHQWMKISARNGGGRVKIAVEDKGIGIAPKDAANIFTPFYRAKSVVDAQIHGNGLGLSLVRQTIEAHGGKISVESQPGEGSRFVIELPSGVKNAERKKRN